MKKDLSLVVLATFLTLTVILGWCADNSSISQEQNIENPQMQWMWNREWWLRQWWEQINPSDQQTSNWDENSRPNQDMRWWNWTWMMETVIFQRFINTWDLTEEQNTKLNWIIEKYQTNLNLIREQIQNSDSFTQEDRDIVQQQIQEIIKQEIEELKEFVSSDKLTDFEEFINTLDKWAQPMWSWNNINR